MKTFLCLSFGFALIFSSKSSAQNCNADFTWIDSLGYVFFINNSTPGQPGHYIWDFGDSTTSTLYNPSHVYYSGPGTYTVCLTAFDSSNNFCDTTCHAVTVTSVAGIQTNRNEITVIRLSPNPAVEQFTLQYNLPANGVVDISLYDLFGREVKDFGNQYEPPGEQLRTFNTNGLAAGTYLLRIASSGAVSNNRLVITTR